MVASPRLALLLKATAKRLNRKAEEADPYLALLEKNWYDTVDSLKLVQVADLQALGIPQRFAKELLQLANDAQKPEQPKHPPPPEGPPPRKRPREPEEDRGWDNGKSHDNQGPGSSSQSNEGQRNWKDSKDSWTWEDSGRNRNSGSGGQKDKGKGKGKSKDRVRKGDRPNERWDHSPEWNDHDSGRSQRENWENWDWKRKDSQEPWEDRVSHKDFQLTHKITFEEEIDPNFPLAKRLIGKGGRNVQHINKETGAWVWLCGRGSGFKEKDGKEADEPMHILVKSDTQGSLDEAVAQTNDLLDTVLQMYGFWLETGKMPGEDESRQEKEIGRTTKKEKKGKHSWDKKTEWNKSKW